MPPDVAPAAPETWQSQLTTIGLGFVSKRAAAFSGAAALAAFGKLSEPELWLVGAVTCTAILCFTWEKVSAKAK